MRFAGYEVIEAADGRDAVARAVLSPPALIGTDLRLPFVDGVGLCDILRTDPLTATVPILMVTTETRATELRRLNRVGVHAVLVKPVSPDVLVPAIDALLTVRAHPQWHEPWPRSQAL